MQSELPQGDPDATVLSVKAGTPEGDTSLGEVEGLFPFLHFREDSPKANGVLNRTLRSLNPFKRNKKAGGQWFNPEDFTAQKREWAKQFTGDGEWDGENHKLFESFIVAGLPPTTDVKSVVTDAHTKQTAKGDKDLHMRFAPETSKETEHRGSAGQPLPPQILYSYPSDKPISTEVASFCFPHGVQPTLLERTPSMSALNEIVYSQRFLHSDACSFIFLMKVADNMPLYGVCCYMDEIVHRPPSILKDVYPDSTAPLSRYLVSAPRCYCLLTHYPFFSLHLKVLHMIMGLERLDRITAFTEEDMELAPTSVFANTAVQAKGGLKWVSIAAYDRTPTPRNGRQSTALSASSSRSARFSSQDLEGVPLPTGSTADAAEAVRKGGAVEALAVAIARAQRDVRDKNSSVEPLPERPASFSATQRAQRLGHRRSSSALGTGLPPLTPLLSGVEQRSASRASSSQILSRASARMRQVLDAQAESLAARTSDESRDPRERIRGEPPDGDGGVESSSDSATSYRTARSSFPAGASGSDDPVNLSPVQQARLRSGSGNGSNGSLSGLTEETPSPSGIGFREDGGGESAQVERSAKSMLRSMSLRERIRRTESAFRDGSLEPAGAWQVMQKYYQASVPKPGEELEFSADSSLQPVHYLRPPLKAKPLAQEHVHRTQVANAEAEAAEGLRYWTIAMLCSCLSLENILLLLTAVLLERQMVLFCPNIGMLSTAVLSLVPLVRPFAWQSLVLPILPALDKMLDLLEAPVPFILGVQYKTSEVASRCGNLIRVNIYKDSIKNAAALPPLPNDAALMSMLVPSFHALSTAGKEGMHSRPMYAITDTQKQAAEDFLSTMEGYLSGMCANLHLHTITDVQTPDHVSLLMKDSFIESFPVKDRSFIKQFVETQMFSVYCDQVLL